MDLQGLNLLWNYLDSLDEASDNLEKAYLEKNASQVKEIKDFILEIKSKIDSMLP
jgi:uncharacterized protein YpuA (DUF1002 family)